MELIDGANEQEPGLPLVSVLMPAYNHEPWIEAAIRSIWNQSYKNVELLIVDDCSTDNTYQVVRQLYEKSPLPMRIFKNDKNLGVCGNLNKLVELSSGQFIMIQADDDIAFPNKVEKLMELLLSDPSIVGVHSSMQDINLDGTVIRERRHKKLNREFRENDTREIIANIDKLGIATQSHICRRTVFDKFGRFDSECTHEAKVLLFREAYMGRVVYIQDPLTQYRIGSGTSTTLIVNDIDLVVRESKKVCGWNYSAIKNICSDLEKLRNEMSAFRYMILMLICKRQLFKYGRRLQILNNKSLQASMLGLITMDRYSISASIKVFFPKVFLFVRRIKRANSLY